MPAAPIRTICLAILALQTATAHALTYPIVGTGQTQCFDARGPARCPSPGQAFYGQDAQRPGNAPRYRDNGDGTVSDLVTGLMWMKDFDRAGFFDAATRAATSGVGGHNDWRVPTTKELYSLILFSGATGSAGPSTTGAPADAKPYLDSKTFKFEYPRQGRFIDAQYVTSTAYTGRVMNGEAAFFGVNFADGRIKGYPQSGGPGRRQWYARWVRGNSDYGKNDFIDNKDGTVTDRATGLTWLQKDSGSFRDRLNNTAKRDGRLDWAEALAFCANLDFVGHRDWPYFWSSTSHLDGRQPGDFSIYIAFGRAMGNMSQGGPSGMGGMGGPPPMGGGMGGPDGPGGSNRGPLKLIDVHGAGAQRSSPKSGDESRLPVGAGPQGDVLRIYNYARCVR